MFVTQFRKFVSIAKRHVQRPENWLDVGCNLGFALLAAEALGFDAQGVEPGPDVAAKARAGGANVRQGFLADLVAESPSFQVVSYFDVIEHIADPLDELKLARSVLAPNGIIVIKVPNCYKDIQALKAEREVELWAPDHKNYFTLATLKQLMARAGFEICQVKLGVHFYGTISRLNPFPASRLATRICKWGFYPVVKVVQWFESRDPRKCDYLLCIGRPIVDQ